MTTRKDWIRAENVFNFAESSYNVLMFLAQILVEMFYFIYTVNREYYYINFMFKRMSKAESG